MCGAHLGAAALEVGVDQTDGGKVRNVAARVEPLEWHRSTPRRRRQESGARARVEVHQVAARRSTPSRRRVGLCHSRFLLVHLKFPLLFVEVVCLSLAVVVSGTRTREALVWVPWHTKTCARALRFEYGKRTRCCALANAASWRRRRRTIARHLPTTIESAAPPDLVRAALRLPVV